MTPLPIGLHVPDRGAAQIEERIDVDGHGVEPLRIGGIECIRRVQNAGIVDEHVESAETLDRLGDQPLAGACGAQIDGAELARAARGADGIDDALPAARGMRPHTMTAAPDSANTRAHASPIPRRRARHQHHFSGKAHFEPLRSSRLHRPWRRLSIVSGTVSGLQPTGPQEEENDSRSEA